MIYQLGELSPRISKSCFIAPNATVIGNVDLSENVSIWFNVVIRADLAQVKIAKNSNIQDGSILHVDEGFPINIAENVTIGHKVMLHGCTIGEGSLIGINAVVLNGAKIGKNCLIGANALVTEHMVIPDGSLVLGSPAKVIKQLDEKTQEMIAAGAAHYVQSNHQYRKELKQIG
ncbi:gamma carbonic anhydrase family protein [Colwellia sp. BRX9-1]|uniref:gamma carbonic anhydrase family protein n=1 Tax=Colwellia sp. BRX9-1 TaxID=2759830 RepID=UPI0015F37A1C|nr:gamma carbonic anhydrase family protein [Colwellia sp. BRX9-1]MBA6352733.1 gamma carbonic anhydrase family protein [Colwellia sp. BRX9-1]